MAAPRTHAGSRTLRAAILALPFAVAACGDDSTGPRTSDLNATSLAAASTSVDAALDVPVLSFLLQGTGGSISFGDPAFASARMTAAASLLSARSGSATPSAVTATRATSALAAGVRAQIARVQAASGSASGTLYDASMYGATYVASKDSVYRDSSRTDAPADGFAVVLQDEASATVGTIEVRDSSTASVVKQAVTIRTSDGAAVAQYTETLSGSAGSADPFSIDAQVQGTIGVESRLAFTRSASISQDASGAVTLVLGGQYTLPGGAHSSLELRLTDPAEGAVSSLTLGYGRSTFRVEVPSSPDAGSPSGWAPSDTVRIIADGRLMAYVIRTESSDGSQVSTETVAPDGTALQASDLLVIQRAQEFAGKLLQVDFVVGSVESFVDNVIAYVQMIP